MLFLVQLMMSIQYVINVNKCKLADACTHDI